MPLIHKETNVSVKRFSRVKQEMIHFFQFTLSKKFSEENLEKTILKQIIPSLTFKFKLDIFQKIAIKCVELKKNILVAAHTSSGKTVIAEYAIAKTLKRGKKVIYTTPIKALSNQKYRDFCKNFSNIGLITGESNINSNGNCIVMTAEILHCILGNRIEELSDLEWVIIDEAHYLKDLQRGFVWEEIFMLLPKSVRIICLSATMPNIIEFSEWLTKTRKMSFATILAQKRPIPLKEYVCMPDIFGLRLFKITNKKFELGKKKFKIKIQSNFNLENNIKAILSKIHELNYGPVILFTFSKKNCHKLAQSLFPFNFCELRCQRVIEKFLKKLKITWSEKKSSCSFYENYFRLLKKGIGIHHADLSPFLKEITETLFYANLLFVLFATETFSIGLNMPSKTVIFSSLVKFDGKNFRFLNREEYIQMSGRAGRRGLDKKGIVISILDKNCKLDLSKKVLKGNPEPIGSVFRVTINTFLNFVTPGVKNIRNIVANSFFEFQKKINLKINYTLYTVFKKRKKLLIFPRFKLIKRFLTLFRVFMEILFKNLFSIGFENNESKISSKILFKMLLVKKSLEIKQNIDWSIVKEKNFKKNAPTHNKSFLKQESKFTINENRNLDFRVISLKNYKILVQMIILGWKMIMFKSRNSMTFLDIIGYYFSLNYRLEFLKFQDFLNLSLNNLLKISVFPDISRFRNSFIRIGLIDKKNCLTLKGKICSRINYKESLVLVEMIYRGIFNDLSFSVVITLLVGLVCGDQYKEVSLHPFLFPIYNEFQVIISVLYSIFKESGISIYLFKILRKKKHTIFNLTWAWCNNFRKNFSLYFSLIEKKILETYLVYVLDILEIIVKIYQSLGDIFLASKFEGFWFKLKQFF